MRYKLERCVNGVWYVWGVYDSVSALAGAAHELGLLGFRLIRVTEVDNGA